MWYLALPDMLIYFTIFFGGALTGILSVFLLMLIYCSGGGMIKIQFSNDEIRQEDY
jgi:hypothetical protein